MHDLGYAAGSCDPDGYTSPCARGTSYTPLNNPWNLSSHKQPIAWREITPTRRASPASFARPRVIQDTMGIEKGAPCATPYYSGNAAMTLTRRRYRCFPTSRGSGISATRCLPQSNASSKGRYTILGCYQFIVAHKHRRMRFGVCDAPSVD